VNHFIHLILYLLSTLYHYQTNELSLLLTMVSDLTRGHSRSQSQARSAAQFAEVKLFERWLGQSLTLANGFTERDVLINRMAQWLKENDVAYYNSHVTEDILSAIGDILDIIVNLIGMLKTPSNLLAVIILYADRFVKHSGIKHNQLFNLLLTSSVVTVKFWNESVVVSNRNMAQLFEFSLSDLNLMENRFLLGVDYVLYLSEDDVKNFLLKMEADFQHSVSLKSVSKSLAGISVPSSTKSMTFRSAHSESRDKKMISTGPHSPSSMVDSLSSVSISIAVSASQ